MNRKPFALIRPEDAESIHIKARGKARCGLVFDPEGAKRIKPMNALVRDICPKCLIRHLTRRKPRNANG